MKARIAKIILQKKLYFVEVLILLSILLIVFCNDISLVPFHPDETWWVVSSIQFDNLIKGNMSEESWKENYDAYEARPIPAYIVAIGQRLGGVKPEDLPSARWDFLSSIKKNIADGHIPNDRILFYSRLPMAILASISLLLITLLLAFAHSRFAAYVFFVSSLNEYFLLTFRRAMSETPLLFFTVLAILATYRLLIEIEQKNTNKVILWSIAIGIFSGLAGQSKLTGLTCGVFAVMSSFMRIYWHKINLQGERLFRIITVIIPVVTIFVFIVSYPFFYRDTIFRIAETFYARQKTVEQQMAMYTDIVILPGNRPGILLNRVFNYPVHIKNKNIRWVSFLLNLCLTALGVHHVTKNITKSGSEANIYLSFLTSSVVLAIPMLFVPLDWDRYYMYPVLFVCIFCAIGIAQTGISLIKIDQSPASAVM